MRLSHPDQAGVPLSWSGLTLAMGESRALEDMVVVLLYSDSWQEKVMDNMFMQRYPGKVTIFD